MDQYKVWEVVPRSPDMRVVGARWVYTRKIDGETGKPSAYKARWVGGGEGSGGEGGAGSNDHRMRDGTRTEAGIGDAWVSDSRSGKICVGGGGAGDGDRDWTDTRCTFSHPAALPDCPPKIDEGVSVPAFISPS